MRLDKGTIEELVVLPGKPAALGARSTESTKVDWLGTTKAKKRKELAEEDLHSFVDELEASQELLWANGTHALLVVLQAMDAAGKDGTIKHVMSGVNPQGCEVTAFKQPSSEELGHDFLWRAVKALPGRGRIGIFNRSYYEEVLVVRVHPELLARGGPVPGKAPANNVWKDRYEDINAFELHLHRNGTRVVKIFLHVSKEEQKRRFLERLDDPAKYWKFSAADLAERRSLGRLHGRLRGSSHGDVHALGTVVRGAGRPQVHAPGPGGRHRGPRHRRDGPAFPEGRPRRSGGAGPSQGPTAGRVTRHAWSVLQAGIGQDGEHGAPVHRAPSKGASAAVRGLNQKRDVA